MADATADARKRMTRAIQALESEFRTIRTGRASASLFDRITVRYYDQDMPLNQVATITVPEARLVVIQPWDLSLLGEVERAIQKSDLSFNPSNDGKVIRIAIPQLTAERRQEIAKLARAAGERARVGIRNVRRDANEAIKKAQKDGDTSEDDARRMTGEVQKLTDAQIAKIGDLVEQKEQEILSI